MQICITKIQKPSADLDQFCGRTIQGVQQGVGFIIIIMYTHYIFFSIYSFSSDTLKLSVFASIILALTTVDKFSLIHYYSLGHYQNHHLFYQHHQQILSHLILILRSCHHQDPKCLTSNRPSINKISISTNKNYQHHYHHHHHHHLQQQQSMFKRIFCPNHSLNPQASSSCERENNKDVEVQENIRKKYIFV
jgi:hypothetical protein